MMPDDLIHGSSLGWRED